MYKKIFFIVLVLISTVACKKSFDVGGTSAQKLSGEWWADLYVDGEAYYGTPKKIMTYNTASNKDSIWVDDLENLYNFKVKAKFNSDSLTFKTNEAQNENYNITVSIIGGKIFPNAAKSATGVVTVSISFKVVFSDDPTTTYEIRGTGRTKWSEDDY
jgi:hypothetical protein